jgi:hypothetical protein
MDEIYASRDSYKLFLTDGGTSELNALQEQILIWTSARVQRYLNRKLKEAERTVIMNTDMGGRIYSLPAYPINPAHTVTVSVYDTPQIENSDYWVHYEKGLLEFHVAPVYVQPKGLSVTYTGGYTWSDVEGVLSTITFVDVPQEVQMACVLQSSYLFQKRKSLGISSISMPDGSVTTGNTIPELLPEVKNILKSFRRWNGM